MCTGSLLDGWEYLYQYSLCTDDFERRSESTGGSYVVKFKVRVKEFSWLDVAGVKRCSFVDGCNFCCVADCTW